VIRVAVEATSAAPGGGLSFLRGALRALAERRDVEVDVFVGTALADEDFGPRTRTVVVGSFRGIAHRMTWVQCVFPRVAGDHDVVFAPGNLAPLSLAKRTVLYVQNAHVVPQLQWRAEYGRTKRRLQRLMAKVSIRRAARVLFISKTLKAWARPYWHSNELEPRVVHPGVPLAFDVVPSRRAGRNVLVVGNLVAHKRVDRAVRAFASLARQNVHVGRLQIAGDEGSRGLASGLQMLAARAGLRDRVDFLGFLTPGALTRAYAESGCYLSTSALEALPLPPLEAMAAGTPVVVPDVPVFHEVCGAAGMYFDDADEAIAARLADALERPPDGEALRYAARECVAAFSWRVFAERVGSAFLESAAA